MLSSESFEAVMTRLGSEPSEVASLYLPVVPRRKFPPPNPITLPRTVLLPLAGDIALQVCFPFLFGQREKPISSKTDFHEYIVTMLSDKEAVLKRPIKIVLNETGHEVDLKLEYCFTTVALTKIHDDNLRTSKDIPYFYHYLVDLISQARSKSELIEIEIDDAENYWLRLRGAEPYRPHAFYSNVTIVVQRVGEIVRIVFAEDDLDFDRWYTYEWVSPHIQDVLAGEPLLPKSSVNVEAGVLASFFKKFSKLFTQ